MGIYIYILCLYVSCVYLYIYVCTPYTYNIIRIKLSPATQLNHPPQCELRFMYCVSIAYWLPMVYINSATMDMGPEPRTKAKGAW